MTSTTKSTKPRIIHASSSSSSFRSDTPSVLDPMPGSTAPKSSQPTSVPRASISPLVQVQSVLSSSLRFGPLRSPILGQRRIIFSCLLTLLV